MTKQNLLTLTLIISGFTLTPVMIDAAVVTVTQGQNTHQSVTSSISTLLHKRGIDEDVAEDLVLNIVDEKDEIFLSMMLQTLDAQNIVSHDDVLEYLSTAALHRQKLDFTSYDNLRGMVSKIKQKPLDKNAQNKLSQIAQFNAHFVQVNAYFF